MNKISFIFLFFFILVFAVNCGGGSSGGDNNNDTGNSTISSLDDIPDVTSIVNGGGSSASLSALMKAVSGTPPKLADIDEDNADTYFWNGLIADINTNGATAEDAEAFWDGEGACRMAQEVGYSFQNISQNGTSLCYMKNAPQAASGTVVETGSEYLEGGDVSTMFNQGSETRIIKVEVTDMPKPEDMGEGMEDMNEEIFIQVYGTASTEGSAGYAVDLWFCHEEATPDSIEQIRVTEATNTITQTNINTGWGNYTSSFTGILTTDSEGSVSYDPNEEQSVVYTFEDPYWGSHKAKVTVDGSQMTTLGWNTYSSGGMSNEHKNYTVSSYTGSSLLDLRFTQAGFAVAWEDGEFSDTFQGAVEYNDTFYDQNNENELYNLVEDFDFSSEDFFTGTVGVSDSVLETLSEYSCSVTPDIVISMDMADTGMMAVSEECEQIWSDMNFCDSESIQQAREAIFEVDYGPPAK